MAMKQPQIFQNRKVVSIHPHGDKLIVITSAPQELYYWFVCDREYSILADNTHDNGIDSEVDAIAIATNVIDNFIGGDDE
jgi:hypothetical protein